MPSILRKVIVNFFILSFLIPQKGQPLIFTGNIYIRPRKSLPSHRSVVITKKRDKSVYVVGYRMHTLTAINAKTGHSFPLISLLAPGRGRGRTLDYKICLW